MATLADPQNAGTFQLPGPLGAGKRRRMRSGQNVSVRSNNNAAAAPTTDGVGDVVGNVSEEKMAQTSKCKGATTIPIFLKKTYKMIDTCDPNIASWTEQGDAFVVKDPDLFAAAVVPQFFDHNKFSSFARQLNFYGFRKMQSKPIRNSDYDEGTAKHVTFHNENFKRGRCDLLKNIQRSTRGGGTGNTQDQAKEIASLRDQVYSLEQKLADVTTQTEERVRRLELDMLARMEQMMLAVQQQQRTQLQLEKATSVGTMNSGSTSSTSNHGQSIVPPSVPNNWDPNSFNFARGSSVSSAAGYSVGNGSVASNRQFQAPAAPTLPPHPKQKQLPFPMPGAIPAAPPADRMNSLRGISTLSRGLSGMTRGASVESNASAVLMRNSWEDKFFSMLMLDGNNNNNPNTASSLEPNHLSPTPLTAPATVSDNSMSASMQNLMKERLSQLSEQQGDDDLSDVSS